MLKVALSMLIPLALMMGSPRPAEAASISLPGFTVEVPDEGGWSRVESGKETVRYERTGSDDLTIFEFSSAKIEEADSDESFLKKTEAALEGIFVERGLLSRHYNYTHNKGVACLAYDAIIRQRTGDSGLEFRKGWICRLPTDKSREARLEAVRLAEGRDQVAELAFLEEADSVLGTLVFVTPSN